MLASISPLAAREKLRARDRIRNLVFGVSDGLGDANAGGVRLTVAPVC